MVLDKLLDKVLPPPTYEFPPYGRLKPWQIRILSLKKNSRGPKVSGNLQTIDLINHVGTGDGWASGKAREAPPYHALSYAAGDLKKKVRFSCDGRIFFIGFSLWQALVRLADLGLPCPIWVDALCINQRDSKERTRQIQQMAEVYRQAQRVWIWLGEARRYTLPAITEMPRLVRVLSSNDSSSVFQRDYDHYFDGSDMPKPKLFVWEEIADLIDRPYFRRLWVLQEAVLARKKTFLCGPHPFRWTDLQQLTYHLERQRLWSFIRSLKSNSSDDAFDFFSDVDVCSLPAISSYRNLDELRDILMSRECSGSRDKVMAVLGLLSADQQSHVQADARLPKLYANFTSLVLLHDINLATFKLAGNHRGHDDLPSWCPDYHAAEKVIPLSDISCVKAPGSTSKILEPTPIICVPRKVWFQIEVTGYRVDKIDSVAPGAWPRIVHTNRVLHSNGAQEALQWESKCRNLLRDGPGWSKGRKVYARTLIGNAEVVKEPESFHLRNALGFTVKPHGDEASTDPHVHYEYLRPALRKMAEPGTDSEANTGRPPGAKRYMADVSRMCTGRAFFRTKQNRIGLGPRGLCRHDIICFLGKATVPFILRPNQPSKRAGHPPVFHLIGEVYIDEFMDGDAGRGSLQEDRRHNFIIE